MLATIHENGLIASRPMTTVAMENETILFFTNEFSGKVDDQDHDNTVYLTYADPGKNIYLHVRGKSSVVLDREKIKHHWKPALQPWFPEGVDDPRLCLLDVKVEEARYWDPASNKMVIIFEMPLQNEQYHEGESGAAKMTTESRSIH